MKGKVNAAKMGQMNPKTKPRTVKDDALGAEFLTRKKTTKKEGKK